MQFEPRERVSVWVAGVAPIAAVAVAMALCAVLIVWTGESVFEAYGLLFKGAFGSTFAISETLSRATPLMLTGLAAAVAFHRVQQLRFHVAVRHRARQLKNAIR